MVKPIEEGDLNVIDYETMNAMIQLKWLQLFMQNYGSFWYNIPSKMFDKCGGLDFLLKCDVCISKLSFAINLMLHALKTISNSY